MTDISLSAAGGRWQLELRRPILRKGVLAAAATRIFLIQKGMNLMIVALGFY